MVCEFALIKIFTLHFVGLNPCFNGRWSARGCPVDVLTIFVEVLILVLMEDGLRAQPLLKRLLPVVCLNPCFNGRWSASQNGGGAVLLVRTVLILVLMEDGLRVDQHFGLQVSERGGLNPCFNGRWSARLCYRV